MGTNLAAIFSLVVYKVVSLIVGLLFSYMGYKLFMSGIWGHAGEINSQFGDNKIVVKKAAPGTFFALFGAIIVGMTVWKGLEFNESGKSPSIDSSAEFQEGKKNTSLPDKPPF